MSKIVLPVWQYKNMCNCVLVCLCAYLDFMQTYCCDLCKHCSIYSYSF